MDVGETVQVDDWQADGTALVRYRGAQWAVVQAAGGTPSAGAAPDQGSHWQQIGRGKNLREIIMSSYVALIVFIVAMIFVIRAIKVVPQQNAWVKERLGKYAGTLTPGLNWLIPFVDRVAYKHSLKEIPLDVPSQVCITRDNTQLQVDGILYFQVTDPMRASYGSSNYIVAVTQLAQTSLRSVIGKLELDKTFEERDIINAQVVAAIDEAALNWGVKVLRYEIKDLTPPKEILHAMQSQITAEREKRALIAASEGRRQEQINIATGEREAFIARSEGEKLAAINNAQGEAAAIMAVADANAKAIEMVAAAIRQPGGEQAVQLKVAAASGGRLLQGGQGRQDHPDRAQQHDGGRLPHQLGHENGAGQQGVIRICRGKQQP
jgi:regulator of protease activity HflC (stomatin/prohibitin superfamily)